MLCCGCFSAAEAVWTRSICEKIGDGKGKKGIIKSLSFQTKRLPSPLSKRKVEQQKNESNWPTGKESERALGDLKVLNARDIHGSRTEDAGYRRDPERNTSPI